MQTLLHAANSWASLERLFVAGTEQVLTWDATHHADQPDFAERLANCGRLHISLSDCGLTTLPDRINTQVWQLDLNANRLRHLPPALARCQSCGGYLANNDFTDLPSFLGALPSLTCLLTHGNRPLVSEIGRLSRDNSAMEAFLSGPLQPSSLISCDYL